MKWLTKKKNCKGFTLIELIVVIVILAILMLVLVPSVMTAKRRAEETAYDFAVKKLYEAAVLFTIDHPNTRATWGSHNGGQESLKNVEITSENMHESWYPYLDTFPKDPTKPKGTFTVEIFEDGEIVIFDRDY